MKALEKLLRILYPSRCIGCGRIIETESDLCTSCRYRLDEVIIGDDFCCGCGKPKKHCRCRFKKFEFSGVSAPFLYDGVIKNAILSVKVYSNTQPLSFLADHMSSHIQTYLGTSFDLITSVPMSKKELARREFNQSELLAKCIAQRLEIPLCKDALHKVADTKPQHTLPMFMRVGNNFGAFDADEYLVNGKNILLIDDIITTGNTLNECAKMLRLAGAKSVSCAAAATVIVKSDTEEGEHYAAV